MATFEKSIPVINDHEDRSGLGVVTDDPDDPGGPTRWGVSLRWMKAHGWDLDGDGDVDKRDVELLTREQAVEWYRVELWDAYGYGRFEAQPVATKVLDLAVHAGPKRSHLALQRAVNAVLGRRELVEDGILGPKTVGTVNGLQAVDLLLRFVVQQSAFYGACIADNPRLEGYRRGWLDRAAWPFSIRQFFRMLSFQGSA